MKAPRWIVPVLVVLAAAGGIWGSRIFSAPSFVRDFSSPAGRPQTVRLTIQGLKCVDTAARLAGQLEEEPGVIRYAAYASRNEAQITYDGGLTNPEALRETIEGPVIVKETGEILFNQYEVLSIDGRKTR